jgi:putative transposase
MALGQRRPEAVIHHSDQGAQYTSIAFGLRCAEMGIRPSMGSVGDCFDNAMCESFFATLECELIERCKFRTQAEAEMAVFDFIEGWYLSPCEFERRYHEIHAISITTAITHSRARSRACEAPPALACE